MRVKAAMMCLTLVACLASMALSVAVVAQIRRGDAHPVRRATTSPGSRGSPLPGGCSRRGHPRGDPTPGPSSGRRIVDAADADGDRHLTAKELGGFVEGPSGAGREG